MILILFIFILRYLTSFNLTIYGISFILYLTVLPIIVSIFSAISTIYNKNYLPGIAISIIPFLFLSNTFMDYLLLIYIIFGIFVSFIVYFFIKSKKKIILNKPENPIPLAITAFSLSLILILNGTVDFNYRFLLSYFIFSLLSSFISSSEQKFLRSILLGISSSLGPIGFFITSSYIINKPVYINDCEGIELRGKLLLTSLGNKDLVCAEEDKIKLKLEKPFVLWIYNSRDLLNLKDYIEIGIGEKPKCDKENCVDLSNENLYNIINYLNNLNEDKDLLIKINKDLLINDEILNSIKNLSNKNNIIIELDEIVDKDIMPKFKAKSSGIVFCCINNPEKSFNISKIFLRDPYELSAIIKDKAIAYPSCNNEILILEPLKS
ncbi:hypothetical protein Calag_1263 [Caldisphaera lagunensis DSM 15908]|uniref:Uncharacterized protein n=1 Tax=Caldisphaera lagunensis (strain DSM 15908 / JCM 11604 / ANMR 0165 / IC-154) TaxID=1056495 RepID=L0AC21_CALLD|nr:hypothetical protein [Caldisphaera lagunensis]AFZ70979.1 hypothetical protein Calag_1263 [Caldisphaera lagunensis DSM 15908]